MAEVKLIGLWASPFDARIQLALKLKGVQYEYVEEDLSNKSPLLLKYNPIHKKIPVLIHNGKPISESPVILEYIDETWKNTPIMPQDHYNRAIYRFWAKFADDKIFETAIKANKAKEKAEKEQLMEELGQPLKVLENELKGKKFFGGESIGYIDIVAFPLMYWFQLVNEVKQQEFITEEKFAGLHKWVKNMSEMDVVKNSLPPRDKLLAFFRSRVRAPQT